MRPAISPCRLPPGIPSVLLFLQLPPLTHRWSHKCSRKPFPITPASSSPSTWIFCRVYNQTLTIICLLNILPSCWSSKKTVTYSLESKDFVLDIFCFVCKFSTREKNDSNPGNTVDSVISVYSGIIRALPRVPLPKANWSKQAASKSHLRKSWTSDVWHLSRETHGMGCLEHWHVMEGFGLVLSYKGPWIKMIGTGFLT